MILFVCCLFLFLFVIVVMFAGGYFVFVFFMEMCGLLVGEIWMLMLLGYCGLIDFYVLFVDWGVCFEVICLFVCLCVDL